MHDTLSSLVERAVTGHHRPLEFYLREHSRLPGPRANLELANDLAYLLASASSTHPDTVLSLIYAFSNGNRKAMVDNTPSEFVMLCGVVAAGACAAVRSEWREQVIEMLSYYACSTSWRVREAVATAFQHLLTADSEMILPHLSQLAASENFLQQRAAVAALAEPRLLYTPELAENALQLQRIVFEHMAHIPMPERKCEDFRTLRRALGYTLSVVAAALPEKSFAFMCECALWNDGDINWILRENLKKKRLAKFSHEITSVMNLLT
ncbi:hypothetical protein KDA_08210 [Dictyobacter alpinus]|uniref:Uncharacterized protein n=1 Tax=Dictyobacter alpinus TaxID=2014873 RepID=A0A402B200_9CHLR|nr:hypothetical protein [Dictyobacter alpinus]GCE25337.1 hypothetical protein KDA_08210 [Dictyobacter alpinus]